MPTTVPRHSSLQCKALSTSRLRHVGELRTESGVLCYCCLVDRGSSRWFALHGAEELHSDTGPVGQRAVAVVGEGGAAAPELVHLG